MLGNKSARFLFSCICIDVWRTLARSLATSCILIPPLFIVFPSNCKLSIFFKIICVQTLFNSLIEEVHTKVLLMSSGRHVRLIIRLSINIYYWYIGVCTILNCSSPCHTSDKMKKNRHYWKEKEINRNRQFPQITFVSIPT